jgi:uncharacterized iron-regulated membrane protein
MKLSKINRVGHNWISVGIAIPLGIVIVTGILLLLKKDIDWIQPHTAGGSSTELALSFDDILTIARTIPEAQIKTWKDVNRLDVRPGKGMLKVRAENSWEVQIDSQSGKVLQVAYRRSDLIESIHDGSYFHDNMKLWVFLPAGVLLAIMWITGMYLFIYPYLARSRRRAKQKVHSANRQQSA